jgi:hypothetical protein
MRIRLYAAAVKVNIQPTSCKPPMAQLSHAADRFDPPEDLLNSLAFPLAHYITGMTRRAPVYGAVPLLSHMRCRIHMAALGHKIHLVIALISGHLHRPIARNRFD